MSSENESNDTTGDLSSTESSGEPLSARAEAISLHEKTECLINLVQKYKFLYDLEDKSHKDKGKTSNAWSEISNEMGEDVIWCKAKWKMVKEYYEKLKKGIRGTSGQKRGKGITWPYYNMMSFMNRVKNSNESTTSSLDFEIPAKVAKVVDLSQEGTQNSEDIGESTRVESYKDCTPKSSLPVKKRNLNYTDELNVKMIEFLDKTSQSFPSTPDEPPDEISCWSRLAASRLRQLHPSVATSVMMQCDQMIVSAIHPPPHFGRINVYDNNDDSYMAQ